MGNRDSNPFATLRRFVREAPEAADEYCELCSVALPPTHRHLFEVAARRLVCTCDPCALRFHDVVGGRFALVPRDVYALPNVRMTDAQWDGLALPINLAFFVDRTPEERVVALYPSPAGVTESLLPLTAWETLVAENPVLERMEPDVEALLVNRVGMTRAYFLAPIDVCYELAGLIRLHWRGLSGGDDVWREIEGFFDRLQQRARSIDRTRHA